MARSAERLTAECPRCGQVFETWALGAPDLDFDPELGDPGWVSAASAATCPHCGDTSCCSGSLPSARPGATSEEEPRPQATDETLSGV